MPTLRVHDFVCVSEIGAATGGGPYKRMKQPWGGARGDLSLIVKQQFVDGFELKLSPMPKEKSEAEPLDMRSQALPGNEEFPS